MRTLVVYFSRTGNTRMVAHRIAAAMSATLEEITERTDRRGLRGYLRSGREAGRGTRAEIVRTDTDLAAFDLVIVGTPVWRASVSSPVRTWLEDHAAELPSVAFFCTLGGFGSTRAFRQMSALCSRRPVATLAAPERQLRGPGLAAAITDFTARLAAPQRPSLLDQLIPAPRLVELDAAEVAAPAGKVWELVRHGDLARSPFVRALFAARSLPARLAGHAVADGAIRIGNLVSSPDRPGFQLLGDDAPRELAVGAIGQVWRFDIPFVHVQGAEAYAAFAEPGQIKVAWALRVLPAGVERSRVEVEVRVAPTDEASWSRFTRYFRVVGPFSRWIRRQLLGELALSFDTRRPRQPWRDVLDGLGGAAVVALDLVTPFLRGARNHWGVDAGTAVRAHPGDDLVPEPRWSWTHGVEIDAPAEEVWGWIAQIGVDRGGFYSYQWLENLFGCQIRNADAVHPEWELREGDLLRLHPDPTLAPMRIARLERGRYLVAYAEPDEAARASGGRWSAASWLFELEPLGEQRCRLISRFRSSYSPDLATRATMGAALVEPIGFAMDRRMLLGVKERAERMIH